MDTDRFSRIDFRHLPSPCFLVHLGVLEDNLKILDSIQEKTGAKILLALKGFSMYHTFPLIRKYLKGVCASSLHEARLGAEEMGGEVHIFSPAYRDDEFDQILEVVDAVSFNSFSQWNKYKRKINDQKCSIRINPEYSEIETALYDPCAQYSRLGVPLRNFEGDNLEGITGLHFHAMCQQNSDTLKRISNRVKEEFGVFLKKNGMGESWRWAPHHKKRL